jgi:hypothetical protein
MRRRRATDAARFFGKIGAGGKLSPSHFSAMEKPAVAATKIRAMAVAFSLPQDSLAELMFEPCAARASCSSASAGPDFPVRRGRSPGRRRASAAVKCFHRHANSARTSAV